MSSRMSEHSIQHPQIDSILFFKLQTGKCKRHLKKKENQFKLSTKTKSSEGTKKKIFSKSLASEYKDFFPLLCKMSFRTITWPENSIGKGKTLQIYFFFLRWEMWGVHGDSLKYSMRFRHSCSRGNYCATLCIAQEVPQG